jgi:general secretion pathway protein A
MYLAYWGLEHSPFAPSAAAPLYYEGEAQAEAAARLRFVVQNGRRLALLVGQRGVGKTLLLRQFAEQARREGRSAAFVLGAGLSVRELLWQLAAQFAIGPKPGDDAAALSRRLVAYVDALRWQRSAATIFVDDADQIGPDVRTQLVRLLALGVDDARLTMVLATTPQERRQLGDSLLEAVDLWIELDPWNESETAAYVQHALIDAGCDRPAFDDEALSALYQLTDGVPRQVNRLADHALLGAAAEGRESIDAAMIEAAHDALAWAAPEASRPALGYRN